MLVPLFYKKVYDLPFRDTEELAALVRAGEVEWVLPQFWIERKLPIIFVKKVAQAHYSSSILQKPLRI